MNSGFCPRSWPPLLLLAGLILLSVAGPITVIANDAALVGQQLVREGGGRDDLRDRLVGLLGGSQMPDVQEVSVTAAEPQRLIVGVRSSGFDGYALIANLLDDAGRIDTRFDEVRISSFPDGEPLDIEFQLPPHTAEGTVFETSKLQFQAERLGRAIPGLEWQFRLAKQWSVPIAPENVVVQVTAVAEGTARRLPARPPGSQPLQRPPLQRLPRETLELRYDVQRAQLQGSQVRVQPAAPTAASDTVRLRARTEAAQPSAASGTQATASSRSLQVAELPAGTVRQAQLHRVGQLQLSDRQRVILQNTDAVVAQLPPVRVNPDLVGLRPEERDRGARGPSANSIDLMSAVHADIDLPVNEILTVRRELYLDKNPDSGVLYYVPRAYNLRWDRDEGFGMKMLYAAVAEGEPGRILMAMRLSSGVSARDSSLVRDLALAYRATQNRDLKVTTVRPLPLTSEHPGISLTDSLGSHFDIPADDLVATVVSDALEEMNVSWVTDEVTKENIELVLAQGIGIAGDVTYDLESEEVARVSIPASVRLADRGTFGELPWLRNGEWRNPAPYPLRLNRLHALLIDNNTPIIYSWNLGAARVPPGARVEWDAAQVPSWIDGRAKRLWIEYAVLSDCDSCSRQVLSSLTFGASRPAARQDVLFAALTPLADLGAAEINIRLRSRYFDSRGDSLSTLAPLIVSEDRREFSAGSVYLVDRQPGEERTGDPLFEYQVDVIMPDGSLHASPSDRWIPSQRNRVVLGTVQIEQALGYRPGD